MEIVEICEKLSQQGRQVSDDAALNRNRVHKKNILLCSAFKNRSEPVEKRTKDTFLVDILEQANNVYRQFWRFDHWPGQVQWKSLPHFWQSKGHWWRIAR